MKAVRLNLENRQSWQKFQHILTSFVSDYIDLVAPEQSQFRFEQQILSLTFTLISASPDRDRANYFTQKIESFLSRLQLLGVRSVALEFFAANGEDLPVFTYGFEVAFIPAPQSTTESSIVRSSTQTIVRRTTQTTGGGSLFRAIGNWLANFELLQNLRGVSRFAIRDPKQTLVNVKDAAFNQFSTAISWVDTFPWEDWFKAKLEWQKRRHNRNLFKALFEDFVLIGLLIFALFWTTDFLSGPTVNLAALPPQHYDSRLDSPNYRCGNPGINRKNYACLTRGMSYRQVASILGTDGKPLGIDPKFGQSIEDIRRNAKATEKIDAAQVAVIVSWSNGNGNLNATFRNDALVAKAYSNL